MSVDLATKFIGGVSSSPEAVWDAQALVDLAGRGVPDVFFRGRGSLLRADQSRLWMRWFMEGLVSPRVFVADTSKTRLHVFEAVLRNLEMVFPQETAPDRKALAEAIAVHLYGEVERQRREKKRESASMAERSLLIHSVKTPRCYLCGFAFSHPAIDAFLRVRGSNPVELPALVDILRPRGTKERHVQIEVEHVVPVASGGGGGSNLKLACGWCNMGKGSKTSIYDAAFTARSRPYDIGPHRMFELPEPFWTVRTIGVLQKCQHVDGCAATVETHELFIALRDWNGAPNPTNLLTYCADHDPIKGHRFVAREDAAAIWNGRSPTPLGPWNSGARP